MANAQKTKKELSQEFEMARQSPTELERGREALREDEDNYRQIFENVNAVIIRLNKYGKITHVNSKAVQYFGFKREELIGKHFARLGVLTAKDLPKIIKLFKDAVSGKVSTYHAELESVDKQGNKVFVDVNSTVLKKGNKTEGTVTIIHDITARRKAEEALKESEEKFSRIFSNSPVGLSLTRLSDGAIIEINDSYTTFTGYKREEIIGRKVAELNIWADPQDRDRMMKILEEKGRVTNAEFNFYVKSGEIRPVLVSAEILNIRGENCLLVMATDISERKQAEEELKESEEFTSSLLKNTPNPIIVITPDTALKYVNPAFEKLTGFSLNDIIGMKAPYPWWPEDKKDEIEASLKETTPGEGIHLGEQLTKQMTFQKKNGGLFTVELNATSIKKDGDKKYILVNWVDITEREKAEKALRQSEEKYRTLFESAVEGIIIADLETKKFKYANPAICTMLGYSQEELTKMDVSDIHPKASLELVLAEFGALSRGEKKLSTLPCLKKDGTEVYADIKAAKVIIDRTECLTGFFADITERKKAEEALRDSEEKFSRAFISSANAVCITSITDHKFIEVNEGYTRFTGYSREEVIGHTAAELNLWVNPEELTQVQTAFETEGKFTNLEFHSRMKSGEIRVGLSSTEEINIGGKPCRIGVITDITERKKIEEKLKESEEFTSTLLTNAPDALLVTYPDGAIKYVNPAFEKLTGFSLDEIIGRKTPYPWWPEDKKDEIEASLKETTPGEGINVGRELTKQMTFQKKNGELFTVELNATIINKDGKRQYILVSWVDITERKKAEEALKESEEKFSKAFISSANAIGITSLKDSCFIEANESFMRFTGYPREEIIGHSTSELNLWVKPEELKQWVDTLHKEGRVFNQEFSSRMKSGEVRIGLASAEVINIRGEPCRIVVITDITELKKAEEALKDSEEKFSKAFHASPDVITLTSMRDGRFIEVNESFTRITGYTREEALKDSSLVQNLWGNVENRYQISQQIQERGIVHNEEMTFHSKSGEIGTILLSAERISIGGEPCLLTITRDITKSKKAEDKLKQSMANLEQSHTRLAAANQELEAFSYSVSHDLRSPLRTIDGFSQALLEDYTDKLDDTGQDYLRRLRNASQKMGELIDGLLRLSRLSRSEIHREHLDLGALASEIATRLREAQPERQAEFIISGDLTAEGDPQFLRALLENLLGNAWKFTSKVPRAIIEFGAIQEGAQKTFFVKDNGAGFDMSYVDKLFGAFQRLHDVTEFPGTGIGLATVRRIVNRHGGTVRPEGEVGKGATFYFTLG